MREVVDIVKEAEKKQRRSLPKKTRSELRRRFDRCQV